MYFRTAFIFIYVTVFSFATHHFSLFVHPFVQSFCLVYVAGSRIFPSCGSETRKLKSLLIGAPVPTTHANVPRPWLELDNVE